eukprot:9001700-Pyramimonas_sp.AAC.1
MTPCQANQQQVWVFISEYPRRFEVDFETMVDPAPDLEPGVTILQINDVFRDQLEAVEHIIPIDRICGQRNTESLIYDSSERDP